MLTRILAIPLVLLATLLATSCSTSPTAEDPGSAHIMEVRARGLSFQAPSDMPAGWTTIKLINQSGMTHFAVIEKLPEGGDIEAHQKEVAPLFQQGMDQLSAGDTDAAMQTFGKLPEWFGKVVMLGGPGLTAPGRTSTSIVHLDPGRYLLECYVKTDGRFHSYNPDPETYGMVHAFTVHQASASTQPPEADLAIDISSTDGFDVPAHVTPGHHVVSVHFEDQKPYANFVGHDVQLIRLDDTTDLDAVAGWMDWTRPHGLETPAPAQFLGGMQEMPAGSTGYFDVDLAPGRYAWIAEIPDPASHGMLKTFTVAEE